MEFLVYSRAAPNAADIEDEDALDEAHWAYTDRFADGMVARGPTLGLGRTMWEFPGASDEPRFMVIAEADAHAPAVPVIALPRERLIVHGQLLTPDEADPTGVALALQATTRDAVDALFGLDRHLDVRILDWECGGRR